MLHYIIMQDYMLVLAFTFMLFRLLLYTLSFIISGVVQKMIHTHCHGFSIKCSAILRTPCSTIAIKKTVTDQWYNIVFCHHGVQEPHHVGPRLEFTIYGGQLSLSYIWELNLSMTSQPLRYNL